MEKIHASLQIMVAEEIINLGESESGG